MPSGSGSRDVQWVQNKARELGMSQSRLLEPMDQLLKQLGRAQTMSERDRINRELQDEAARVRQYLEKNEADLLDVAKQKFKASLERKRAG